MFQTTANHFVQQMASPALTAIMEWITALGYVPFFFVTLCIITFGLDLRRGLLMLEIVLLTAMLTFAAKEFFAYPRPYFLEPALELRADPAGEGEIAGQLAAAEYFFSSLPEETLGSYRSLKTFHHGFPSGHTSLAITFWGSLALLFRNRWMSAVSIAFIVLIPFSRIYLGVHFLGDVIGGYILGGIILLLFYGLAYRRPTIERLDRISRISLRNHWFWWLVFLILPTLLWLIVPRSGAEFGGSLLGIHLAAMALSLYGFPREDSRIWVRAVRSLLALGILVAANYGFGYLFEAVDLAGSPFGNYTEALLVILTFLFGTTAICYALGWYVRPDRKVESV